MKDSVSLIKNSGIYSFIMLLQKGINFLLIPVLTIFLTTEDYGIVAIIMSISAFLNVFYLLALNGSLNRFYYEYEGNEELIKSLFGTIITFVVINGIVITVILVLARKWLIVPFLDNIDFFPYMLLGLISTIFNPCFAIYQSSLQARQKGKEFGKNNSLFFIVNIILLLLGVTVFKLGAIGVLGALATTNIIFFIYTIFQFRREFDFGIDKKILSSAFKYSLPLIPHNLSGVVINIVDRILINKLLSTNFVGIYSIGSNFANIVFFIVSGVGQAFTPWFNSTVKKGMLSKISKISKPLIILYCIVALGISFFGKEIIFLLTPIEYHEAWKVIPFICFAFVFHGVYYFFIAPLFYDLEGRGNRIIPFITISTAILNIALNYFFIPLYGIIGAGISIFISKVILSISISFIYKGFVNINYPITFMFLVPSLFFIISLGVFLPGIEFATFFMLKMILYLAILLVSIFAFRKETLIIISKLKS